MRFLWFKYDMYWKWDPFVCDSMLGVVAFWAKRAQLLLDTNFLDSTLDSTFSFFTSLQTATAHTWKYVQSTCKGHSSMVHMLQYTPIWWHIYFCLAFFIKHKTLLAQIISYIFNFFRSFRVFIVECSLRAIPPDLLALCLTSLTRI